MNNQINLLIVPKEMYTDYILQDICEYNNTIVTTIDLPIDVYTSEYNIKIVDKLNDD